MGTPLGGVLSVYKRVILFAPLVGDVGKGKFKISFGNVNNRIEGLAVGVTL